MSAKFSDDLTIGRLRIWLEFWPDEIGLGFNWKRTGQWANISLGPLLLCFEWGGGR